MSDSPERDHHIEGKRKKSEPDSLDKEEEKKPAFERTRVNLYMVNPSPEISDQNPLNEFKDFESMLKDIQKQQGKPGKISQEMLQNYNDGRRIFVNRLIYYPDEALQENMITFYQLMFKDLGYKNKMKGDIEVRCAIMSTMVFEA